MIVRHIIGLAIALFFTWMVFFGANFFGVVWTHYFADEPTQQQTSGEVSATIVPADKPPCPKGKPC